MGLIRGASAPAAIIIAARRTPIVTAGHQLRDLDVVQLTSPLIQAITIDLRAAGLAQSQIDDVLVGVARDQGGNPARRAVLAAGMSADIAGVTVDRQCGSGLDAIALGAGQIALGGQCVVAGGAESASTGPPGRAAFTPPGFADPDMGLAAQRLADDRNIDRARQDRYARQSHQRALTATAHACFAQEIMPIAGVTRDTRPRSLKSEVMARLPGAFIADGSISAANSCGISDGAALVGLVSDEIRQRLDLPGLAIRGVARIGVDPAQPAIAPAPAIQRVLSNTGLSMSDLDRIEITEAFAGQMCAVLDDLGLGDDDPRVCADGGAIALGHPWGASGAVLMVRLFTALVRQRQGSLGVAACAVAGGQGFAVVAERVGP